MNLLCRTYESIYPKIGTVTVAVIKEIKEIGAYVSMYEYDFIQGMLLLSEISRKKIRSINKLLKISKKEIISILRVDIKKGYIDVSKKQMAHEEIFCMKKKNFYSKLTNSLCYYIAKNLSISCEDLKIRWLWPLYRKYGHAIRSFRQIDNKECSYISGLSVTNSEIRITKQYLKNKISKNKNRIDIFFEMKSFSSIGIKFSKNVDKLIKKKFQKYNIDFFCQISPEYLIRIVEKSKRKGVKIIVKILKFVEVLIKKKRGGLVIKTVKLG